MKREVLEREREKLKVTEIEREREEKNVKERTNLVDLCGL